VVLGNHAVTRTDGAAVGSHHQRLLSAPVTVDPDIPRRVAQARHDIDDLYALQTTANNALSTLQGQQRRLANRVDEVQQTLDLHGGRLDRIEDNQRQQVGRLDRIEDNLARLSGQMTEVLTVLRGLGPSD
jgi:septal ring factor EnvC (AmiA/AmiB activator)